MITDRDWLASLKDGDEVLVRFGRWQDNECIGTIERTTSTQFVVRAFSAQPVRIRRADGHCVGDRYSAYISPATDEARQRIRRYKAVPKLRFVDWEKQPDDVVFGVVDLLKSREVLSE